MCLQNVIPLESTPIIPAADQQAMMETFRTYCYIDAYGRLNSFQFYTDCFPCTKNCIHMLLAFRKSQIRVSKPRIGGGFGAKQTAVSEIYPAFVTWMTKKPSKTAFIPEKRAQIAASPRHEMEVHCKS